MLISLTGVCCCIYSTVYLILYIDTVYNVVCIIQQCYLLLLILFICIIYY